MAPLTPANLRHQLCPKRIMRGPSNAQAVPQTTGAASLLAPRDGRCRCGVGPPEGQGIAGGAGRRPPGRPTVCQACLPPSRETYCVPASHPPSLWTPWPQVGGLGAGALATAASSPDRYRAGVLASLASPHTLGQREPGFKGSSSGKDEQGW